MCKGGSVLAEILFGPAGPILAEENLSYHSYMNTVDREKFAGLNIRSFTAIKIFTAKLLRCLGHNCPLFSTTN